MRIVEDSELRRAVLERLKVEYGMDKQRPGTHQSELSYCLTKAFWDRTDPEPVTDKEVLLFSIGFGLERVLLHSEDTPPEIDVDGIKLSLDTIELFGPSDLKTTRMSPTGRKGEDGFQWPEGWKRQMATYRHGLNVQAAREGKPLGDPLTFGVVVVHLIQPSLTCWRITYEPWELADNWGWMLTRRDQLDSMLEGNNPMPFVHNEDWECTNCRYLMRCQLTKSIEELTNA